MILHQWPLKTNEILSLTNSTLLTADTILCCRENTVPEWSFLFPCSYSTPSKSNVYLKSIVYKVITFKQYTNSSITEAARYTILHSLMSKNNKSSTTDKNCRSISYGRCNTRNSVLSLCPATKHQDNYYSYCHLFTSFLTHLIKPHSIDLLVFQMMISSYFAWVLWSVLGEYC
jgi:hypothetical protein